MRGGDSNVENARLHKALSHPLRRQILTALDSGRVASPAELAAELDVHLSNISYHFKTLVRLEAIELVDTQPVRGTIEHFYRSRLRPTEAVQALELPEQVRASLTAHEVGEVIDRIRDLSGEGGLGDSRSQVRSSTLDLDEQGQQEVAEVVAEALERVSAIQAEAGKRLKSLPKEQRQTQRAELALMHLMRADGAGSDTKAGD
jgi:DNA-binding transcriptional ArsR family regulator